jgi:hypothetical protein
MASIDVYIGGLMRCCTQTIRDMDDSDIPNTPGTIVPCAYCDNEMYVDREGAIRWAGYGGERDKVPIELRGD